MTNWVFRWVDRYFDICYDFWIELSNISILMRSIPITEKQTK